MHTARVVATLLLGMIAAGPSFADDGAHTDGATAADPADPEPASVQPAVPARRWHADGAFEADGYRISVSRGAVGVGMRFEPRTVALRPTEMRAEPASVTLPALSLELRSISAAPASASNLAARALGPAVAGETAISKVGVEWKPAQSQVFFNGGVGVHLNGDDSVVMRLRKGTLGVYVKRSF